jgi:hypothetical protein
MRRAQASSLGEAAAPPRPPLAWRLERRMRGSLATLQARDQLLLTLGILWVLLGTAWLARYPATFPLAHVLGLPPVLAWLAFSFAVRRRFWAFYLCDFCYFANALAFLLFSQRLLLPLLLSSPPLGQPPLPPPPPPHSDPALAALFSLCLGPLLLANVFWRTTLAFHSPDKMCSVFIHIAAPLACFALRWFPASDGSSGSGSGSGDASTAPPISPLRHLLLLPFAAYALWQALYLCVTELGWTGALLRSDVRYETSLRFQAASLSKAHALGKGGALGALGSACGVLGSRRNSSSSSSSSTSAAAPTGMDPERPRSKLFFMATQAAYTLATQGLAALAWHSFPFALALVLFVICHTVYQGAGFYVTVFAARYLAEAQASVEEAKGSAGSGGGGGGSSRSTSMPSGSAAAAGSGGGSNASTGASAFPLPPSVAAEQAGVLSSIRARSGGGGAVAAAVPTKAAAK